MPGLLKRLKQRFGISAPRVTIRAQLAWYWRWTGVALLLSMSLALAAWMYDAGRRYAGFDSSEAEAELAKLRTSSAKLAQELAQLRSVAGASEARLKIEQSAQAQLVAQVKALEQDNARLREDVAFFENLLPRDAGADRISIHRFKVERDVLPGEYRYRLVVMHGGNRNREFRGSLQLVVELRRAGRDAMIVVPAQGQDAAAFRLTFRHFHRAEGTFRVPPEAQVLAVQARVMESGSQEAKASQSVRL